MINDCFLQFIINRSILIMLAIGLSTPPIIGQVVFKDSTKVDILEFDIDDRESLDTLTITLTINNGTKYKGEKFTWIFSENVKLKCESVDKNDLIDSNSIEMRKSFTDLQISLPIDFSSPSRFNVKKKVQGDVVYQAYIKYPILKILQSDLRDIEFDMELNQDTSLNVTLFNAGLDTLKTEISFDSNKKIIASFDSNVIIPPFDNKTITIDFRLEKDSQLEPGGNIDYPIVFKNSEFPKNSIERKITFAVKAAPTNLFLSQEYTFEAWIILLMTVVTITSVIIAIILWMKWRNKKVLKKNVPTTGKPDDEHLISILKTELSTFVSHIFKQLSERQPLPDHTAYGAEAKRILEAFQAVIGHSNAMTHMIKEIREVLKTHDENKMQEEVLSSVELIASIRDEQLRSELFSHHAKDKGYLSTTLSNAKLLQQVLDRHRGRLSKERFHEDISSLIEKLDNNERQMLTYKSDIASLIDSLENPDLIVQYRFCLKQLRLALSKIREARWDPNLKKLFFRMINETLNKYISAMEALEQLQEDFRQHDMGQFKELFTEVFRLYVFSKFGPYRKKFEEMGVSWQLLEGAIKSLEGFWIKVWGLQIIAPSIYKDTFDQHKHEEEQNTMSHILREKIVFVDESDVPNSTIKDFYRIGLCVEQSSFLEKAKVYLKRP